MQHDDVPTAVEDAVARLDADRTLPPAQPVGAAAATRRRPPRLRLVPTLPVTPAPHPTGPSAPPPLLRDRARLVAATRLRTPVDDDDDRGAEPVTDAGRFAHGVGLACVEVALGRRPAAQLARWVVPAVLESLQERADLVRRSGVLTHSRVPTARRVRVCPVDGHTAEACLVVDDGVRVRAVALRLEAHRGAWRVATLEIG
ncbi:hypothetical protein Cph01nite_14260 [Cellulomonas phragmiteti]|uniref:Energy transducer TonB n=2 Tax=Cellulomonas phragmiteti TaxID=478780 RepID=A0ABQ4DJY1_9CELL|nr:hypothetical protein Cph01nite_14260 [Cellulomonas phragmiteti]